MSTILAVISPDRGRSDAFTRGLAEAMSAGQGGAPASWSDASVEFIVAPTATTLEAERERQPLQDLRGTRLIWDGRLDDRDGLCRALALNEADAALTDGELVLAAYARWDLKFVDHLVGDWAVIVWDPARMRLIAAKDPLGWRPLFFAEHAGALCVLSDRRMLFDAGMSQRPNEDYLRRYLADAQRPLGQTAYEGVSILEGGQMLLAESGKQEVRTYWDRPRSKHPRYRDPARYVEEFEHLVDEVTRSMVRTNGPIVVSLSGGLDSSYVAAVAARHRPDLVALSTYAPGTAWDERPQQQAVVARLGIEQIEVDVSDCWALNERHVPPAAFDDPDTPAQHALQARTAEVAAEAGLPVMLTGVGGDEWLSGDPDFIADAFARGHPIWSWRLAARTPRRRSTTRVFGRALYSGLVPRSLRSRARRAMGGSDWRGLLPLVKPEPDWLGRVDRQAPTAWRRDEVEQQRWRRYRQDATGTIEWGHRHSYGAHGIELRSPLNDLRVVEFLASVPDWVKRFDGRPKAILRAAIQHEGLPALIHERTDKASYDEPFERGLQDLNHERISRAVDSVCTVPGVNAEQVRAEVDAWRRENHSQWESSWRAISAGLWLVQQDALRSRERDQRREWPAALIGSG